METRGNWTFSTGSRRRSSVALVYHSRGLKSTKKAFMSPKENETNATNETTNATNETSSFYPALARS